MHRRGETSIAIAQEHVKLGCRKIYRDDIKCVVSVEVCECKSTTATPRIVS